MCQDRKWCVSASKLQGFPRWETKLLPQRTFVLKSFLTANGFCLGPLKLDHYVVSGLGGFDGSEAAFG